METGSIGSSPVAEQKNFFFNNIKNSETMSKYNSKHEAKKPTETNFMGETAFKMETKEELVSSVMTTFLQGNYYEGENTEVNRIKSLLDKVEPEFAAKLALYARNDGKMRSVTHMISSHIAPRVSGKEWGKRFYNKIVVRPDDISEIVSSYAAFNGMGLKDIKRIPNSMKKGFKTALERFDAYQIDKYKMNRRDVSMIDLVNMFHPKGTQKNCEAYRRLINGLPLSDLYDSKILEKTMANTGKVAKTEKEKVAAKHDAISEVFDNPKGMPIMNLVRNLKNIITYAPDKVDEACEQLAIVEKIKNSRMLPFRFATAFSEIENMAYPFKAKCDTGSIKFESDRPETRYSKMEFDDMKKKVLNALEGAIEIACINIPKLDGKTAILIDHSGSVRGDGGGSSKVSAFSEVTTAMIGNLFGSMMAYSQDDVYIGLFGDRLIDVPVDRKIGLLNFNKKSFDLGARCGGRTEAGIYDFMRKVVKDRVKIDNIVVFSDCQIGDGNTSRWSTFTPWYGMSSTDNGGHFQDLFKEFRKINPNANFIVCNLRQSGNTSVFDKSQRILNIAGWSEQIFDVIKGNCKGWGEMIKEIEAIEL